VTIRYLAIEGIDGAGKTTVAAGIAGRLRDAGRGVITVREPGGTEIGEAIRSVLLDPGGRMVAWTEALLFAAGRAQLAAETIRPALERGETVVSDRSVYSSLAYQGGARRLGMDLVRSVNEAGLQGVWPELVVLLRLDPETGLAREDVSDRISVEGIELQAGVADAYECLAADEPERFLVVDARESVATLVDMIVRAVEERS
jgi:dTMP kinase